jgi:hypothetical protein
MARQAKEQDPDTDADINVDGDQQLNQEELHAMVSDEMMSVARKFLPDNTPEEPRFQMVWVMNPMPQPDTDRQVLKTDPRFYEPGLGAGNRFSSNCLYPDVHSYRLGIPPMLTIEFYDQPYPSNHWALHLNPKFVVGTWNGFHLKLNPSDSRGYRLIICLGAHEATLPATFNRAYTSAERGKMWEFAVFIQNALLEFGVPIVQLYEAGNNAQRCAEGSYLTHLGNEQEPSMLHAHLVCRGVPGKCYFPRVPLTGPPAGEMFDLRGLGHTADGQRKLPWTDRARTTVRRFLEIELAKLDGASVFEEVD